MGDLAHEKAIRLSLPTARILTLKRLGEIQNQFAAAVRNDGLWLPRRRLVLQEPVTLDVASRCRARHHFTIFHGRQSCRNCSNNERRTSPNGEAKLEAVSGRGKRQRHEERAPAC